MALLNDLPLATIIAVVGIIGALIALINGSIDFEQFMLSIGAVSGGAGVLGHARNGASHGITTTGR